MKFENHLGAQGTDENRGTNDFAFNIHWWFWNGSTLPGLLTAEQFSNVRDLSLAPAERSELSRQLVADSIISFGRKQRRSPRLMALLRKVSDYLETLPSDDPNATLVQFLDNPADALKAYLNVLGYWEYGYSWRTVFDVWGHDSILIEKGGNPLVVVNHNDVQFIQGRPYRFEVSFKGLSWHFNEGETSIRVLQRHRTDDGSQLRERWI